MSALVDAADILAQPEDEVIVTQYGSERDAAVRFGDGEVGNFAADGAISRMTAMVGRGVPKI